MVRRAGVAPASLAHRASALAAYKTAALLLS